MPSCELRSNDFSSKYIISLKTYQFHCDLFLRILHNTFSPVNTKLFSFVCERCVKKGKMNNLLVDVKISIKNFYFKLIFNNINENCDPFFLLIDLYHTYFWGESCLGCLRPGEEVCPGLYVLEPTSRSYSMLHVIYYIIMYTTAIVSFFKR